MALSPAFDEDSLDDELRTRRDELLALTERDPEATVRHRALALLDGAQGPSSPADGGERAVARTLAGVISDRGRDEPARPTALGSAADAP